MPIVATTQPAVHNAILECVIRSPLATAALLPHVPLSFRQLQLRVTRRWFGVLALLLTYNWGSTVPAEITSRRSRSSKLILYGLVGLIFGTGLLLLAVAVGHMRGDPNPNPVFAGILAGVTFWPSLICVGVGLFRRRRE